MKLTTDPNQTFTSKSRQIGSFLLLKETFIDLKPVLGMD